MRQCNLQISESECRRECGNLFWVKKNIWQERKQKTQIHPTQIRYGNGKVRREKLKVECGVIFQEHSSALFNSHSLRLCWCINHLNFSLIKSIRTPKHTRLDYLRTKTKLFSRHNPRAVRRHNTIRFFNQPKVKSSHYRVHSCVYASLPHIPAAFIQKF